MSILRFWYLRFCRMYYETALQHIEPHHPDVPFIVLKLVEIEDKINAP